MAKKNVNTEMKKMCESTQTIMAAREDLKRIYEGPLKVLHASAERLSQATVLKPTSLRFKSDDDSDLLKIRLSQIEEGLKAAEKLPKDLAENIKLSLEKERDKIISKLDDNTSVQKIMADVNQGFLAYIKATEEAAKIEEILGNEIVELKKIYDPKGHAEKKALAETLKSQIITLKVSKDKLQDDPVAGEILSEKVLSLEEELKEVNSCLQIYDEAKNLLNPLPAMEEKIPPITTAVSPEKAENKPPVVEVHKPEGAEKKAPKKEHEAELLVFQKFLKTGLPIVNAIGSKSAWENFVERDYLEKLSFNEIVSLCSFLCSEMGTKFKVATAFYEVVISFLEKSEDYGDASLVEKLVDAELIKEDLVGRTPVRFKDAEEYSAVISAYINDYINGRELTKYADSRFIFNDEEAIKAAYAAKEVA